MFHLANSADTGCRVIARKVWRCVASLCLLAFIGRTVALETESIGSLQYDITQWTTVDGLPSNTIQSLLQTRDGFLWIGTRAGLARFDGVKMRVFNRGNTPEMEPSDNCICMTEDMLGTLWIGTKNGLLAYRKGSFLRYENDAFSGVSLANSIWSIAPAQAGGLWVSTEFGSFRWENGRWQPLTNFPTGYLRSPRRAGSDVWIWRNRSKFAA